MIAAAPSGAREAVIGADVLVDGARESGRALLLADGRIEGVLPVGELPDAVRRRDVGPGLITPGFIDIHTHGAGGRSFNSADPAEHCAALASYLDAGVTTVLPTITSAPLPEMIAAIQAFRSAREDVAGGPRTPGMHLEGPYFSPAQCGAQDVRSLRRPDDGSADRLLEHADAIRVLSLAPELPGAVALTRRAVASGIIVAAGHSDCRDSDLAACQEVGLTHVIHLVSGQSTTVRRGLWRVPGLLEATLASDDLTVEMIGDGKHLPATLLKMAVRSLAGRLCLVSDSTQGAGMPDGYRYRLGGTEVVVSGGVGVTADRTAFGGSTTLLPRMVPIVMELTGLPLAEVIEMVTAVPARAAGLDDVGRIAPGYRADLLVLDPDLVPRAVAVGGLWHDRAGVAQ